MLHGLLHHFMLAADDDGHHDGRTHGGGTLLYDSVYIASDEPMKSRLDEKL
jgi:hypothetical protein